MLKNIKAVVANDNELDSETLRLLSLIFLLICGLMSFFKYTHVGWLWDTHKVFKPGFISSIVAISLVAPLYLRGILKWNKSTYTIISLILILLVFASFIELALGGRGSKTIIIPLLASAVILSWLGISAVAGVSWMLALSAAILSAISSDLALGFFGFIYIVSGFIGLMLHSGLAPGDLIQGIQHEYSSFASNASETINKDISSTIDKIT
ncbi:hypothetical protein [Oceanisphaera sp. W20_SRM_FM3]|uniref:hypothetical protein n=1 Tax=Oceanisphaera sp. W20_SRM_FM3 TaxID=3240267 RepID=UPI003F9610CD